MSIPSPLKAKRKQAGVFLKMQRVSRLKLERDRAPDDVSHGVISRLVRIQLLNQCAHEDRAQTVKVRKRDLLAKTHAHAKKVKREEDRTFHKNVKLKK